MKKSTLALLTSACLLAAPALQAMSWQELQTEIDSVESGNDSNPQIILRFSEIVQTLVSYYRAVQEADPDAQLFCLPANGSFQLDEIVSMVRAEARKGPAAGEELVQDLMLQSFRERFPCE